MSNPKPAITFRVNTETVNRQGHLVPNRLEASGNETVAEADDQKNHRHIFIPGLTNTNHYGQMGNLASASYLKHNSTFVEYGLKALYIKNTYATGTGSLLTVVSTSWD